MRKLIIFDCDGTLVDSEIIANIVSSKTLSDWGYPISAEEEAKKFIGLSDKQVIDLIIADGGPAFSIEQFQKLQDEIMKSYHTDLRPLISPTYIEKWSQISDVCVASSSPRGRVRLSLEVTQQSLLFPEDKIFTAEQVKYTKPAPDLFLLASERLGYQRNNCLVIEDSVPGILAAKSSEMEVIAYLAGRHTYPLWYKENILNLEVPIAYTIDDLDKYITIWHKDNCLEKSSYEQKELECVKRDAYL